MRRFKFFVMVFATCMILTAFCGCENNTTTEKSKVQEEEKTTIKIGSMSSNSISVDAGIPQLEKMGYKVEVIVFDDAVLPNIALQEGSIDINIHQHTPYLEAYIDNNPGESLSMAKLLYFPNYGLYSTKYNSIDEIPNNALIGLYSDASNVDRGLRILETAGLIKLSSEEKDMYSEIDIVENPKKLQFKLVNFGTGVRAMEDLDACMATGTNIKDSGRDPLDALVLEDREKAKVDFSCGIAAKTSNLESKWLKDIIKAYTSDESRNYMTEQFGGASIPIF